MSWYGGFRPYVPVAVRRARALKKMEKLRKKGLDIKPVQIEGRKITRTFWGQAWRDHCRRQRRSRRQDRSDEIGRDRCLSLAGATRSHAGRGLEGLDVGLNIRFARTVTKLRCGPGHSLSRRASIRGIGNDTGMVRVLGRTV